MNTASETIKRLHDIDTEYALKKKDAMKSIIEARHALREKSSSRNEAEEALQNAQDSYTLLNLEHQAERSRIWADLDRTDEEVSIPALAGSGKEQPDGVYFVLEDGRSCLYIRLDGSRENFAVGGLDFAREDVKFIGIKMGETKIAVTLKEQVSTLVNESPIKEPSYTADWEQARLFRLNGKEDTRFIVEQGTAIKLAPQEYIPSLFELNIIYLWRKYVDEALEFIGAEKLKDDWYWSSTSRSANYAWCLGFTNGIQGTNLKSTNRSRVRPVSAFAW